MDGDSTFDGSTGGGSRSDLIDIIVKRPDFLPGVNAAHVMARLQQAGGNELRSGKLLSSESSAALAVNAIGWFVDRPALLPPLPGMEPGIPAILVDVEYCARFPWSGGRHPWLDGIVETPKQLVGIESKRFEPYRDRKAVSLSTAYDRPVWGDSMGPYQDMRDRLRTGTEIFEYLDAAQLVKHAFGLVTDGGRKGKEPVLIYLYAEPAAQRGHPIDASSFAKHRDEIARFAKQVDGAAVSFGSISYREWIASWSSATKEVAEHGSAIVARFAP